MYYAVSGDGGEWIKWKSYLIYETEALISQIKAKYNEFDSQ